MGAEDFLPERRTLDDLREAAASCRGCDLYRHAEQTVFGQGLPRASILLVGEQPGDQEDRRGERSSARPGAFSTRHSTTLESNDRRPI